MELGTNIMLQGIEQTLVSSNKYIVRLARSEQEIQAAQKLRFNIFNVELGEGLESACENELDIDKFDEQCHHLLVIERATDEVIGTYRMQTCAMAEQGKGFYTAEEFELNAISDDILQKGVEVGRACIKKNHRNGRVLFLLWRGLAKYLSQQKARYLFGCCSITSQSAKEAWEVMDYLKKNEHFHSSIMVKTMPEFHCPEQDRPAEAWKDVKLPQLFRLYIDLGARVCSPPALDTEFKTIDYLILLDIEKLDERTRLLFFK